MGFLTPTYYTSYRIKMGRLTPPQHEIRQSSQSFWTRHFDVSCHETFDLCLLGFMSYRYESADSPHGSLDPHASGILLYRSESAEFGNMSYWYESADSPQLIEKQGYASIPVASILFSLRCVFCHTGVSHPTPPKRSYITHLRIFGHGSLDPHVLCILPHQNGSADPPPT